MSQQLELTKEEFLSCFEAPMVDVGGQEANDVDIWTYVDCVSKPSDISDVFDVAHVYQDAKGRFDQVLIATNRKNVFLVIVVDLEHRSVFGHRFLDLSYEYGLKSDSGSL